MPVWLQTMPVWVQPVPVWVQPVPVWVQPVPTSFKPRTNSRPRLTPPVRGSTLRPVLAEGPMHDDRSQRRVFLSHASEDKPDVQRLRVALADRGIGAWEDVLE